MNEAESSEPVLERFELDRFGKKVEIVSLDGKRYVVSNNVPAYLGVSKYAGEQLVKKYLKEGRIKRKIIIGWGNAKYVSCQDLDMIRREILTVQDIDE